MEKRKERIINRIIKQSKKYERFSLPFIFYFPEILDYSIEFQKFMNGELNYKLLFYPVFKGGIVCIQDLQC
jgi:hypothetical protein